MPTSTSTITINAPAARVWDALTRPELVKDWQYGSQLVTDWQVGRPIRFRSEWQGQVFEQWGTVLEVEPNRMVKYSLFAPRPGLEEAGELLRDELCPGGRRARHHAIGHPRGQLARG